MTNTDKIPLKAIYSDGVPYALGEFTSSDFINPYYASYNKPSNTVLNKDNLKDNIDIIEEQLVLFNTPTDAKPYFDTYSNTDHLRTADWTPLRNDIVLYDTASAYNNTTFKYTIPVKGIWKFSARASYSYYAISWFPERGIDYFVNNTLFRQTYSHSFDNINATYTIENDIITSTLMAELNVGDVVDVRWKQEASPNDYIKAGRIRYGFSGYLHRTTL